jgi:hypothetical protein
MAASAARTFTSGADAAEHHSKLAENASVMALISTAGDEAKDWLAAGQAMQRALLVATAGGVSASFLNACIEVPRLRIQAARAFAASGHAQILLRLGHGTAVRPTPRRPAGEILG